MKIGILLLLCSAVFAIKSYTPDYFVKKHNLQLPGITKAMLDVSRHTHKSTMRWYTYSGTSKRVDSSYQYLDLQAFPANMEYKKHRYSNDTEYVNMHSVNQMNGTTTTKKTMVITEAGVKEVIFDSIDKCSTFVMFNKRGKRKYEKRKCVGDAEPAGQEFTFTEHDDYIESIETRRGKIYPNIRRLYLSSFDSVVADYIVRGESLPILQSLYFYSRNNEVDVAYKFNTFHDGNKVAWINKYTYNPNGKLHRMYYISRSIKNITVFKLLTYTEYEYDKLGRVTKITTHSIPDPKYQKQGALE